MKKIFFLFTALLFINQNFAQNSVLAITSLNTRFILSINGVTYTQTPTNSVEINQLQERCYDLLFTFPSQGNAQYHTSVYVPNNAKIVYLLKFNQQGIPKLLPISVQDFDDPNFNLNNYANQVQGLLTNPFVININIQNQNQNQYQQQGGGYYANPNPGVPAEPPAVQPVPQAEFMQMLSSIQQQDFESDKLALAKQIIRNNPLTSAQILQIIQTLDFENDRLKLAKFAYNYVIDPYNYYLVFQGLEFSSSKQELNRYINNHSN